MAERGLERWQRLPRAVYALLSAAWRRERPFLVGLVLLQIFFARRIFQSGIWADNDSVCHYAYVRHLIEEFYPETGTFLGYSPKFNMGVPFLLYNTPPGIYVVSALVATAFHVSALAALKTCVLIAFVSVPVLGFAIAKTFDDVPKDAPKFVAIMLALFSSELYGLELFFKFGMLNPAIGVPLMLATLYFFRRAQRTPFPETLRHIALGGLLFACTVCTHLVSTYMVCLALGAFILGRRPAHWGHDVLRLGMMLGLGGALSAFWLVPSVPFAASEDAAYIWIRRPQDTLASFLDGSLFSSYFSGFVERFITVSNVGLVAVSLGGLALAIGIRRRAEGPLSAFFVFLFGFIVMLGPAWSIGVRLLPAYDRLLWYRFLTLSEIGWLILAGFGAAYLAAVSRLRVYSWMALTIGFGWALTVMSDRASKIEMASDFPGFMSDVDRVVAWLEQHGDRRGRIFGEFLHAAPEPVPSVNYTRHMMPVLSGFSEVGGWVYENNLASQVLMKKGAFWYSPLPLIDEAPRYNLKYILAGSEHSIRALSFDPRWREVVKTQHLVLFENVAYEPVLAEGSGVAGNPTSQRYLPGGGYEYVFDLANAAASVGEGPLIVKIGYLPHFKAYVDDHLVTTRPSADGLLQIELPGGTSPRRLRCVWDVSELRAKGNRISGIAVALTVLLVGASFKKSRALEPALERPTALLGIGVAVLAGTAIVVRGRHVDLSFVGFGVRHGIAAPSDPGTLKVGRYDDTHANGPVHVLDEAWDERMALGREPGRALSHPERPALRIALAKRGPSRLTIRGEPKNAALEVTLEAPGQIASCEVHGALNRPIHLPAACTSGEADGKLPGVTRDVRIRADVPLTVTSVSADSGITFVEAESLQNAVEDGGYDAFYTFGALEAPPSNGLVMTVYSVRPDSPVDLTGRISTRAGRVEVWSLIRTQHPRLHKPRAEVSIWIDGKYVGGSQGEMRAESKQDTLYEWTRVGETELEDAVSLRVRITTAKGASGGRMDVDAIAFVPM